MAIDTIKSTAVLDGAIATADIADGSVTTAKLAANAVTDAKLADFVFVTESNYVLEQWRLTTNEASNNAVVDNWERVDDATSSAINAGMTQSSGVWTFPSTGLWLVTAQVQIYIDTSDGTAGVLLQVSSNSGSAWDSRGAIYEGDDSSTNTSGAMSILVNVTNASTFRFQLATDALDGSSAIVGDTNISKTALLFERKGPSQ